MQAAVPRRPATGRRRGGPRPPLAVAAAAVLISTTLPAAAHAEPVLREEAGHPRITTVDRTEGLDPEGDTVTVSGVGHTPGSVIEITTLAVPVEASDDTGEALDEAVTDTENAVAVEVGEHGAFSATFATGAGFATAAGLDAAADAFEILLVEVESPEAVQGSESPEDPAPATTPRGGGADGDAVADELVQAPGAGMSAPVLAPAAPAATAVVGRVPVTFAVPAAAPQTRPQTTPRTQAAPQAPLPRTPGDPRITVSKTEGLDPNGETVTVTGTGYDTSKGIYVALCDTAGASSAQPPSPCIGGVDMDGSGGTSVWVSSDPPPYGEGLAVPYSGSGTDGGFSVRLTVKADDGSTNCNDRGVECAVVTRNDHTRSSDRGQDRFVPVAFADGSGGGSDPGGSGSGDTGSGGSGSGGSGSGGSGSGSGGTGSTGSGGGSGTGPGSDLPRTGTDLTVLLLTAAVATATGAFALFATRRRDRGDDPLGGNAA